MPYIKPEQRPDMDEIVELMKVMGVKGDGDLNYILYAFCVRNIKPRYGNYKNYCGELRQCATEIERRLLGPYEDEAVSRNGDIR